MSPKIMTREEAEAVLPQVRILLERILHKRSAHERHHDALLMEQMVAQTEGHPVEEGLSEGLELEVQFMESNIAALEADLAAIRDLGGLLRSLNKGFVDFLSKRNGEMIYLCWRRGEDRIRYYHPVGRSSAERLPL